MTPFEFATIRGACQEGLDWVKHKPNWRAVFATCPRPEWLMWILCEKRGEVDWPGRKEFRDLLWRYNVVLGADVDSPADAPGLKIAQAQKVIRWWLEHKGFVITVEQA